MDARRKSKNEPKTNPARLYFGEDALKYLNEELPQYGKTVQLIYGGGSCCDYAKAVSVSVHCDEDPWEKYYIRFEEPDCEILPVGCVLTMAGTGSGMNGGAVITNHEQKLKIGHVFGDQVMLRFAILNPEDYEARSNIMWTATWVLNTLVSRGKSTDWMVHMLGQSVGAYTDAAHGMTLSAVSQTERLLWRAVIRC